MTAELVEKKQPRTFHRDVWVLLLQDAELGDQITHILNAVAALPQDVLSGAIQAALVNMERHQQIAEAFSEPIKDMRKLGEIKAIMTKLQEFRFTVGGQLV